jgi:hypothetical protein
MQEQETCTRQAAPSQQLAQAQNSCSSTRAQEKQLVKKKEKQ